MWLTEMSRKTYMPLPCALRTSSASSSVVPKPGSTSVQSLVQ